MKILPFLLLALFPSFALAEDPGATSTTAPKIPNSKVLDREGKELTFYDDLIKDKVVAINFVFSSCPTICPAMEVNFSQLQQSLKASGQAEIRLISVTVDPENDTPARLKKWSQLFKAEKGWSFITGKKQTIHGLLKSLEVFTADINDHPSFILIGNDSTGTWKRVNSLASPELLAKELTTLASAKKK